MISQAILNILVLVAIAYVGLLALEHLKKILMTHTATVSKQTDDNETVGIGANFYVFDTEASRRRKLDELHKLADDRMAFVFERFQAKLREEREKKAAASNGVQNIR